MNQGLEPRLWHFGWLNFALTWATDIGYLCESVILSLDQKVHVWHHENFRMRLDYLGHGAFGIVWKVSNSSLFLVLTRQIVLEVYTVRAQEADIITDSIDQLHSVLRSQICRSIQRTSPMASSERMGCASYSTES